jgi:hypothetical protein
MRPVESGLGSRKLGVRAFQRPKGVAMHLELEGKTALVTGSTAGIG